MSAREVDLESLREELTVGGAMTPPRSVQGKHAGSGKGPTAALHRGLKKEEIKRLLVQGYTFNEIRDATSLSRPTLSKILREPEFIEEVKALGAEVFAKVDEELSARRLSFEQRLTEAADRALGEMERLAFESENDNIRLKANQDILDRDGRAPRTARTESRNLNVNIDLDLLKAAAVAADEDMVRGR